MSKQLNVKRFSLVYELLGKGFSPKLISQRLNVSLQSLNRDMKYLKSNGYIKKIGYGLWEQTSKPYQVKTVNLNLNSDTIRGHAFIWKVRFNKQYNWLDLLNKLQINYDELGIHQTPRVIINNKKIWLGKKNIVIYFNKNDSFYGFNSIESKKLAVYNLLDTIRVLEDTLKLNLGQFKFTCAREHFSLINNCLAIQCDKEGKSINVYNQNGMWMTIDNSLNLHETEAVGKDAMLNIEGIKRYFNSHNETKFKVTPEFILNTMNGIQQNQSMFAKNIESHIKAIQDISLAVNELTIQVKRLNER